MDETQQANPNKDFLKGNDAAMLKHRDLKATIFAYNDCITSMIS